MRTVNFAMVRAYWEIGRIIVEEEQSGKEKAEYGRSLIEELSERLTADYGRGFTTTNLWYMRQFYLTFTNLHALRGELTWTHYRLLLKVEEENIRSFYMLEAINNNWSTRELERQISSLLYERIALSRDKEEVKEQRWSWKISSMEKTKNESLLKERLTKTARMIDRHCGKERIRRKPEGWKARGRED